MTLALIIVSFSLSCDAIIDPIALPVMQHLDKTVTKLPKAARQDQRPVGLGPMEAGPGSRRPLLVSSNLLQQQCLLRYVLHCICTGYTASACLLKYLSPRQSACDTLELAPSMYVSGTNTAWHPFVIVKLYLHSCSLSACNVDWY